VQADEIESKAREPTTVKLHESAIAITNGAKSRKWEALFGGSQALRSLWITERDRM